MRLGYDAKENRERANYCRFNEAEAHAPRIHYPGRHTPAACRRFNEAEAHAPRIRPGISSPAPNQFPASMRPRRMRLGYLHGLWLRDEASVGFNEAEAHAPRIRLSARLFFCATIKLQ